MAGLNHKTPPPAHAGRQARICEGLSATGGGNVQPMSFKEWAEKTAAAGKAAQLAQAERKVIDRFEGVTLTASTITHGAMSGPVQGAVARVEHAADIQKRVTAARLVTLGVFAFAAKKQTGHVFLTVEGDGFEFAVEVPVKKEADARKFAAKVNAAAKR